jgi:hypothetical protein
MAEARQKMKAEAPGEGEKSIKGPSIPNEQAPVAVQQTQTVQEESSRFASEESPRRPAVSAETSESKVASSEANISISQSKPVVAEKRLQAILVSVAQICPIMSDSNCIDQNQFDPSCIFACFQ